MYLKTQWANRTVYIREPAFRETVSLNVSGRSRRRMCFVGVSASRHVAGRQWRECGSSEITSTTVRAFLEFHSGLQGCGHIAVCTIALATFSSLQVAEVLDVDDVIMSLKMTCKLIPNIFVLVYNREFCTFKAYCRKLRI